MEKHKRPKLKISTAPDLSASVYHLTGKSDMAGPKREKTSGRRQRSPTLVRAPKPEAKAEANEKVVYVGQKPVKNYVVACLASFSTGSNRIVLKARGRAICKAVDTIELLRRRFMKDAVLQGISICTEHVTREGDKRANVSAIEITVVKP
jgi:DNA-binding protein